MYEIISASDSTIDSKSTSKGELPYIGFASIETFKSYHIETSS
ncbi:MAG: hypothetical protein P1U46_00715 [Patescibacteria group bacterium]|nr:hypothetical protein [Patescibacteria group bacterium]